VVLGHEYMGVIEEVSSSVQQLRKGDRVVVPFNVALQDLPQLLAWVHERVPGDGRSRRRALPGAGGWSRSASPT
jgi:NADPH:quinone reductase-like Zn-dependent oxidoreductase